MLEVFIVLYLKIFFILTPFFLISSFLSMTVSWGLAERRKLILRVTIAILITLIIIFFIGQQIFNIFGITIDSFRVGTGALLFLSAIGLIKGENEAKSLEDTDISVVPLAIPIAVGPATTGTILVLGAELNDIESWLIGLAALFSGVISVSIMLYISVLLEKVIKKRGLSVLSKVTGLILAAISAQMIMTGVKSFFKI